MDSSSPENQPPVANPYSAPKSVPKPFAKSYLTLAICGGLIVTSVAAGAWLFLRAEPEEVFIHRGPPIMEEEIIIDQTSEPAP